MSKLRRQPKQWRVSRVNVVSVLIVSADLHVGQAVCSCSMYTASQMRDAAESPVLTRSWFGRAWEITSDLLIATAIIWAFPLLLGAVVAAFRLLARAL